MVVLNTQHVNDFLSVLFDSESSGEELDGFFFQEVVTPLLLIVEFTTTKFLLYPQKQTQGWVGAPKKKSGNPYLKAPL